MESHLDQTQLNAHIQMCPTMRIFLQIFQLVRQLQRRLLVDLVAVAQDVRQVLFFGNAAIVINGEPEAVVRGSKYELMRIFQNIFKNALEAGAVRLTATFVADEKNYTVTIVDNGPGMDPDRVKRVLHGGFSSKASGTGLGLSICRHLVGAHGGVFELKSAMGQGTTVRMVFPKAAAAAGA